MLCRWLLLSLVSGVFLGCAQPRTVPRFSEVDAPNRVLGADGWYQLGGLDFKGALHNGKPEGAGVCRSNYYIDGRTQRVEAPCDFRNGERIDQLHALRMAETARSLRSEQQQSDQQQRELDAARIRENNESVRAFDNAMRANVIGFNQRLATDMARVEAASRGSSVEEDRARAQREIEFRARIAEQDADPDSQANRDKRERERKLAESRQAEANRLAARAEAAKQRDEERRTTQAASERDRQRNEAADKQRQADEAQAQQQRDRDRQAKEKIRQDKVTELARQREAEAQAAREKAEKERIAREKEAERQRAREAERQAAEKAKQAMPQALAFCWQNDKKTLWWCDGPNQEIIIGEEDREDLLKSVHCPNARQLSRGLTTLNRQRTGKSHTGFVYDCGYKLDVGDTSNMTWNRDIRRFWNGFAAGW